MRDLGRLYDGGGERYWRVVVRTPPGWPKFHRRVYTVRAYTDSQAGQEGLQKFAHEIDGTPPIGILMV